MKKDFTDWHYLKIDLQKYRKNPYFSEQEIWLCSIGLNLGHEEDGKGDRFLRPVIIFRKFTPDVFWAIPLTSGEKEGPYYFQFSFRDRNETAVLSQIWLLDRKRLLRKMGRMTKEAFSKTIGIFSNLLPKIEIPSPGEEGISRGAEAHCDLNITLQK